MINFAGSERLPRVYDRYLMDLVSHKSVYTNPNGIEAALAYCRDAITRTLPRWKTYYDTSGNLVAHSNNFDHKRNAVLLSAHVDTVDANPEEWQSVTDPFRAAETATHIIGRGANDCKAGVAMMLVACHMDDQLPLENVLLLFSYREEGNQAKTSTKIGMELGRSIPLSDAQNFLVCLENTVKIEKNRYFIDSYDAEPCNVFVAVTGPLDLVRHFLQHHPEWKPVAIRPEALDKRAQIVKTNRGVSGHAATVKNSENVIYQAIMDAGNLVIDGGDDVQTSVIDNEVRVYDGSSPVSHAVVLNYRGLDSLDGLKRSLSGLAYREHFPFIYSAGSDRRNALSNSLIKRLISQMPHDGLEARFTSNPGRSDASAIWNATSRRDGLEILAMGPGTRSHVDQGIPRKTHGPDEGFHKDSGHRAVAYMLELTSRYLREIPACRTEN